MRPQKLTMQAFGSYGQKTIIDFTKTDQNLFLVTGDTGDVYKRQDSGCKFQGICG